MSPIISTLTNNWTAGGEVEYLPYYIDRSGDGLDGTTFNGGSNGSGGWGYGGGNTDSVGFSISGPSAFKLISISNAKFLNQQSSQTFKIRVEQASGYNQGTPLYQETRTETFPSGNGAFEIPLTTPVLCQPNTTYVVGWGFPNGTSSNGNSYNWSSLSGSLSFYDPLGNLRNIQFSDPS